MACNAFEYCSWFLKHLGKVMILVVFFFVLLTCAAVVDAYEPRLHSPDHWEAAASLLGLLVFSALVVMLSWSYMAAVVTEPGRVPPGWSPFATDEEAALAAERFGRGDARAEKGVAGSGRPRFCRKCQAWKPERAHHDSVAGRCVLKMDHYCVWIANSVGLLNYKAFLLFLGYTFLACGVASAMLLRDVAAFFSGLDVAAPDQAGRFALTMIAFVVDVAFCLSLAGLLAMHARMVWLNCTTIEMFEKAQPAGRGWPFDRGARRNFEEVFGTRWWQWLRPDYSMLEKARMLDAALLAPQQSELSAVGAAYAMV